MTLKQAKHLRNKKIVSIATVGTNNVPCELRKDRTIMTVKELKEQLKEYNNNAEVLVVDWANGTEYEPTVGGDDKDEYTDKCRIGF